MAKSSGVVVGNWAEALQGLCSKAGHWNPSPKIQSVLPSSGGDSKWFAITLNLNIQLALDLIENWCCSAAQLWLVAVRGQKSHFQAGFGKQHTDGGKACSHCCGAQCFGEGRKTPILRVVCSPWAGAQPWFAPTITPLVQREVFNTIAC